VFHELVAADALSRRDGRPLLALLHDVGWPCSRRDMYYAPATPARPVPPALPEATSSAVAPD
jgi:hypothetical protein